MGAGEMLAIARWNPMVLPFSELPVTENAAKRL
jgi:hypothetical protein